ncbi:hypothetical protein Dip510_000795 [Elusimicrobium posterum]|uniref:hypothetical protein n=1 Tax=Elusimicrobium posterum TaxID=3116653 RepID=UPI003C760B72
MKIKVILAVLFLTPLLAHAATVRESDRITVRDNVNVYSNFPSNAFGKVKITFVTPHDYKTAFDKEYPSVYMLGKEVQTAEKQAVFVFIQNIPADAQAKDIAQFINNEVAPYTDLNYRTSPEERHRILAASGEGTKIAAEVFPLLRKFNNLALLNAVENSSDFGPKGKIWISGERKTVINIAERLNLHGHNYGEDMLYRFTDTPQTVLSLPLDFLFYQGKDYLQKNKFKLYVKSDISSAPLAYNGPVEVTSTLKFKNGLETNVTMKDSNFKVSPVIDTMALDWNVFEQAFFLRAYKPENNAKKLALKIKFTAFGESDSIKLKFF